MKKFVFIFILYVLVFFSFLSFCQNSIMLSLQDIKPYVREVNFIINDYNTNLKSFKSNIDNYIVRVKNIKSGISNLKKPYVLNEYFKYRIISIENLEVGLKNMKKGSDNINESIDNYNKYSKLSNEELKKIFKKTLLQ